MPCLITALSELNPPRYMTPAGIWDAVDAEITTYNSDDLTTLKDEDCGLAGSPTKIAKASDKVRKGAGTMFKDLDPDAGAAVICEELTKRHYI